MMKRNYQTSEFWFTVVSFVFSGLFILGIINDFDQKEELISDISHGVESVFLLSGQFVVLYKYMKSRSEQKKAYADLELAKEVSRQVELELAKRELEEKKTKKPKEEKDDEHRIDLAGSGEADSDAEE